MKREETIIKETITFVKQSLEGAEAGHDWYHIQRVWKIARQIAEKEKADLFVVELAALLHDIADSKFHEGDERIGPMRARQFLESLSIKEESIEHIEKIIANISYSKSLDGTNFSSPELKVVQDADRLDAIGAIGIARTFNYGGFKNHRLYDPAVPPNLNMSKEEYKKSNAPTLNHFYEKLFLLKDLMNTKSGREIAEERHQFMKEFVERFLREWNLDEALI